MAVLIALKARDEWQFMLNILVGFSAARYVWCALLQRALFESAIYLTSYEPEPYQ